MKKLTKDERLILQEASRIRRKASRSNLKEGLGRTIKESAHSLTSRDIRHLKKCQQDMELEEGEYGYVDGPEVVMTSLGYVELWLDGDVVQHGRLLCNLEECDIHENSSRISQIQRGRRVRGNTATSIRESRSSKTPDQIQVGDIFVSSWGYDQTNIDFYQVIDKTPSGKSVTLAPMTKKRVESSYDYENKVVPGVIERGVQPLRRKLGASNYYGSVVRINSFASAYPWEGKPESETAAGYGH